MDLIDFLQSHKLHEKASFHMPGHKGPAFFERFGFDGLAKDLISADITEIPGADDLRHAEGAIRDIENKYAKLYGAGDSFISVNGSSAAIIAAIRTLVRPEHKLVLGSNSHISALTGLRLAGASPVFVTPKPWLDLEDISIPGTIDETCVGSDDQDHGHGISGGLPASGPVTPESVAKALDDDPDADAVLIVSPDYLGVMSDIKGIAEEVHKRGKALIVDQAHGAHLKFFDEIRGEASAAESQDADIVINSTHKTLASFTQSSEVNIFRTSDDGDYRFDPGKYKEELLGMESTSPSYILMASHAVNAAILEQHREAIRSWNDDLDRFYEIAEDVAKSSRIRIVGKDESQKRDISKIIVKTDDPDGFRELINDMGIIHEFDSKGLFLFMTGIGNTWKDYEILLRAIDRFAV